jgi:oligoribonuclease
MASEPADLLVWIDTETTGLDPLTVQVLELGLIVTDLDLEPLHMFEVVIHHDTITYESELVRKMHADSGLHAAVMEGQGLPMGHAEEAALNFIHKHVPKGAAPMCGSSVQFDRLMMEKHAPRLHGWFHYRNIDTSSIKETCRRYNPKVYAALETHTAPAKLHRVIPDLGDTLNEYQFYLDNFLFVDPEVLA